MLSQNQSRYLTTIGFALLALLYDRESRDQIARVARSARATVRRFHRKLSGLHAVSDRIVDSHLVFAVGEHAVCVVVLDVQ